jgi:two-component system, cell cycle sensor histidine kinase and response regulator CckA
MPSRSPRTTILVVDDEEGVRALLRRQLASAGHTVLEAGSGPEALGLVRQHGERLGLVLADVVMPAMNGTELAAHLAIEFPRLPVVLMSAYAPAGLARVGFGEAIVPVLRKPFDPTLLLDLVRTAITRPHERGRTETAASR